jgi:hypothetical protein
MIPGTDEVLAECVRVLAAAWVASWRETLLRDRRAIEGGWPGTVGEARALVTQRLLPELAKRGLSAPAPEVLARVSHETYVTARRAWLAAASPEE